MAKTVRFEVTWKDVNLILAELYAHHTDVLHAPLLGALLAAATSLDADASRFDIRHEQTTDLRLAEEHAQPFREWLQCAVMRCNAAGDHTKAQAFVQLLGYVPQAHNVPDLRGYDRSITAGG